MTNLHGLLYALFSVTSRQLAALLESLSPHVTQMLQPPNLTKEAIRSLPDSTKDELVLLTKRHQEILATAFHEKMTHEQSLEAPNKYQQLFFRDVVNAAKNVGYEQLLCMDFHYEDDHSDPMMKERFTVNPFINTINQMHATISRRYE